MELRLDALVELAVGFSGLRRGDLNGLCRASSRRCFLNARGVSMVFCGRGCYSFFPGIGRIWRLFVDDEGDENKSSCH